jgi:hypothetical protein
MKKRGMKKNAVSSRRRSSKSSSSIMETGPIFSLQLSEALQSAEEMQKLREETLMWIRQQAEELETILLRYNSFDMIANLMITQLASDPDSYKETTHMGLAAIVEYVTLLYLKHPFNEGEVFIIDGPILEQIENKIRGILLTLNFYYASETAPRNAEDMRGTFDSFRYRTLSHELLVRAPEYKHHQEQRLRALFEPAAEWMLQYLGFTVNDVLKIEEAIEAVTYQRRLKRREEAVKSEQEFLTLLHAARSDNNLTYEGREGLKDFIEHLKTLRSKPAKKFVRNWMIGWMVSSIGNSVYSFATEEIAVEACIPVERVQAALSYFSLEFGSISSDFYMPSPTHELKTHPYLHHNGTYLSPLPASVVWAIQPRLEESLNPNTLVSVTKELKPWKSYERNRAEYLERETLRLLGQTFKNAQVYRKLKYTPKGRHITERAELDGLIIYDTNLFLVEAKAGTFSASARRGSKSRLKRDLGELFGRAHSQALRAKRYIEGTDKPIFITKEGQEVALDKSLLHRTFLITVTLEPMDIFNSALHQVAKAGVLEKGELPWAVSLDVLRVITELNEFPTQLVHYLTRRLRLNDFTKLEAHDELDWFGLYLSNGLYFENDKRFEDADFVHFDSFTTSFDDYYLYEAGIRQKPASKPVQPMPKLFRDIILELDSRHNSQGHSEAVLQLLDWNDKSRKEFIKLFKRIRELTAHDGNPHDFTICSEESRSGVSCFSAATRNAEEVFKRLQDYVQVKKYQMHADRWLGLLMVVNQSGLIHGFMAGDQPWEYDEQLEEVVQSLFGSS